MCTCTVMKYARGPKLKLPQNNSLSGPGHIMILPYKVPTKIRIASKLIYGVTCSLAPNKSYLAIHMVEGEINANFKQ